GGDQWPDVCSGADVRRAVHSRGWCCRRVQGGQLLFQRHCCSRIRERRGVHERGLLVRQGLRIRYRNRARKDSDEELTSPARAPHEIAAPVRLCQRRRGAWDDEQRRTTRQSRSEKAEEGEAEDRRGSAERKRYRVDQVQHRLEEAMRLSRQMNDIRSRPRSYLGYCVIAAILLGCLFTINSFHEDNSATMAPYLGLHP